MKSSNYFRGRSTSPPGMAGADGGDWITLNVGGQKFLTSRYFQLFTLHLYIVDHSHQRWMLLRSTLSQVHNLSEGALLHAGSYVRTPRGRCRSKVVLALNYKRMPSFFILINMILSTVARTSPVLTCWTEVRDTLSLFSTTSALAVLSLIPM